MIFAKLFGISWMLAWFFIILKATIKSFTNGSGDLFAFILTLFFVWALFGLLPVLIVKFGWSYIR